MARRRMGCKAFMPDRPSFVGAAFSAMRASPLTTFTSYGENALSSPVRIIGALGHSKGNQAPLEHLAMVDQLVEPVGRF
jgi:hypothetical protein